MSDLDEVTKSLLADSAEIERLAENTVRAAEGRRPLPTPLKDYLTRIGELTTLCEEAIADHAEPALGKETSAALATALGAIRIGIDSLVVYHALQGTTYSTTTVAND
jgi:hypothetical protein